MIRTKSKYSGTSHILISHSLFIYFVLPHSNKGALYCHIQTWGVLAMHNRVVALALTLASHIASDMKPGKES